MACETPKSPPGDYNALRLQSLALEGYIACETPKSPPGDYNRANVRRSFIFSKIGCETPKSPPGDYNSAAVSPLCPAASSCRCETPKSPPGDYNTVYLLASSPGRNVRCVKHLNPRQGITIPTVVLCVRRSRCPCETPKSPPGDYNYMSGSPNSWSSLACVKHLNPRQGITICHIARHAFRHGDIGVKHLNPRQGITIQ